MFSALENKDAFLIGWSIDLAFETVKEIVPL